MHAYAHVHRRAHVPPTKSRLVAQPLSQSSSASSQSSLPKLSTSSQTHSRGKRVVHPSARSTGDGVVTSSAPHPVSSLRALGCSADGVHVGGIVESGRKPMFIRARTCWGVVTTLGGAARPSACEWITRGLFCQLYLQLLLSPETPAHHICSLPCAHCARYSRPAYEK